MCLPQVDTMLVCRCSVRPCLQGRRQGYPSSRVKDSPGFQAKCYRSGFPVTRVNSIFGNRIITNKMADRRKILAATLILLSDKAGRLYFRNPFHVVRDPSRRPFIINAPRGLGSSIELTRVGELSLANRSQGQNITLALG